MLQQTHRVMYCKTCGVVIERNEPAYVNTRALNPDLVTSVEHPKCHTLRLEAELDELSGINKL